MKLKITANGHPHEVVVDKVTGEYKVTIDGQIYKCVFKDNGLHINGEHFPIEVDGGFDGLMTVKSSNRTMQVKVEQVREIETVELESIDVEVGGRRRRFDTCPRCRARSSASRSRWGTRSR